MTPAVQEPGHPVIAEGAAAAAEAQPLLALMERGEIATRRADGSFAVERDAPGGNLLYGPFWRLAQGSYRLVIRCQAGAPKVAAAVTLGIEIIAETRVQLAWRDFTAAEMSVSPIEIDFTVPPELSDDAGSGAIFEFRLSHFGNVAIAVSDMTLLRQPRSGARPAPGRRRLPCDPDPRRALPAGPDGFIAVRRWARAGQFLRGVGVPGGLPAGRYRLRFGCRAGRPRNRARPVLGVEIVNGYLSHCAEFFADEIGGMGAVDFAVPPRLGIESGAPASIAVRFLYRRNAPIAVGDVALEALDTAGEGSPEAAGHKMPAAEIRKDSLKDLIIIGNCHAAIIYQGFRAVPALARYFRPRFYDVNLRTHLSNIARRDLQECGLLVVQDIADWDESPLRDWVSERAEIVMFPCIRFASPWPFDACNGATDHEAIAQEAPNFTFTYLDGLLGRLRREIPDPEERFRAYRSLSIDGVANFVRAHQFETRRILALDKKYASGIGQFMLDRFPFEQIFYTTNHPNSEIFRMLMANIMKSLAVEGKIRSIAGFDQLNTMQVPVHPMVAEALGIRWAPPERKYRFRQEELTWEQYVRRYIRHYG